MIYICVCKLNTQQQWTDYLCGTRISPLIVCLCVCVLLHDLSWQGARRGRFSVVDDVTFSPPTACLRSFHNLQPSCTLQNGFPLFFFNREAKPHLSLVHTHSPSSLCVIKASASNRYWKNAASMALLYTLPHTVWYFFVGFAVFGSLQQWRGSCNSCSWTCSRKI